MITLCDICSMNSKNLPFEICESYLNINKLLHLLNEWSKRREGHHLVIHWLTVLHITTYQVKHIRLSISGNLI